MKHTSLKYALAVENNAPNYFAITAGKWGSPTVAKCWDEETARLIAAAPEMLTALGIARAALKTPYEDPEDLKKTINLITKTMEKAQGRNNGK